jgi:UDP-N-acetylglucosamine 2-epimerase
MEKLRLMTIVGTRPEIIKMSAIIKKCDKYFDHFLVHTGQNYDYTLNEVFFKDLGLREPAYYLGVVGENLGQTMGNVIAKSYELMMELKPDAIIVLGDTNSCLCVISAKRLKIPIFHMEAGNRCFDFNVPEEVNRRIIDHLADFNLVYTEHARRHLLSEGLPHRRIYLTGSPMREVLNYYKLKIDKSNILKQLSLTSNKQRVTRNYFLVSTHREENVDNPENLRKILTILNNLAEKYGYHVIVSTHPRTRKRMELMIDIKMNEKITFLKPFGFIDWVHLQQNALCTISDSGTISEESAILSFPAISLRQSMERPEAQDAGTIILTGFDPDIVLSSVETTIEEHKLRSYNDNVPDYSITDTSWRVLKLIIGNTNLSNRWHGVNK